MLKALSTKDDGSPLIVFGLSHKNLRELKKGNPIKIQLSVLGLVGEVFIFAAETEHKMEKIFEENFKVVNKVGGTCSKCGTGLREDGSCDCKDSTQ